jgi:hypothetical protein
VDVEKRSEEPTVVTYKSGRKYYFQVTDVEKGKKIHHCHHSRCKNRSLNVKRKIKNTYSSKKKYIPENNSGCKFNRGCKKLKKCQRWDVEKKKKLHRCTKKIHRDEPSMNPPAGPWERSNGRTVEERPFPAANGNGGP